MKAWGKRERSERVAPGQELGKRMSPEEGRNKYFGLSGLGASIVWLTRGDVLRSAQHLPLAIILRAVGAVLPLSLHGVAEAIADG